MLIKPVRSIHGGKKAPHGASASRNGHQPEHHLCSFRLHENILPAIFETLPSLGRQSCQFSRGDRHGLQISPNPCPARLDAIVALFLRNSALVAQQQGYFAIDAVTAALVSCQHESASHCRHLLLTWLVVQLRLVHAKAVESDHDAELQSARAAPQ